MELIVVRNLRPLSFMAIMACIGYSNVRQTLIFCLEPFGLLFRILLLMQVSFMGDFCEAGSRFPFVFTAP